MDLVGKVMSPLFNMLSRSVITFLPRSKWLVLFLFARIILISYLIFQCLYLFSSVQLSRSVVSDSLWPHESQHARPPCPSPTPWVHQNPCPLSRWCHPTISSSVIPYSSLPSIFPSIRVFPSESLLHIRWPKYWSFSFNISPSKEHPGLISFRMDWLNFLAVQESSPTPQFKSINSSALSLLHSPTPTSIHDHWKNHSLD